MYDAPPETNVHAILALVLGCISVFSSCLCFGLPFNLAGLALGTLALVQLDADPTQRGRGLAIGGIVTSLVSILLAVGLQLVGYGLTRLGEL